MGQFYTLKATADTVAGQPSIELFIDDLLVAVFSDTVAGPYTGKAGLRVRAATAVFDDFRLESLPPVTLTGRYVYNEVTGALMHELDTLGNIVATYVTDDKGEPVSVTRFFDDNGTPAAKTYFYHYNVHGDVIALTGENGQQVATFSYDAWGVPTEYDAAGAIVAIGAWTTATGGTPGDTLYFLFGGMLYDAVAGLYITRTRAYNPKTGRFLQRDILDEKGKDGVYAGFPFGQDAIGSNLYGWCGNNPVNMVDPSGMLFGDGNVLPTREDLKRIANNPPTSGIPGLFAFGTYLQTGVVPGPTGFSGYPYADSGGQYGSSWIPAPKREVEVREVTIYSAPNAEGTKIMKHIEINGEELDFWTKLEADVEAPLWIGLGVAMIGFGGGFLGLCAEAGGPIGVAACAPAGLGWVAGGTGMVVAGYEYGKAHSHWPVIFEYTVEPAYEAFGSAKHIWNTAQWFVNPIGSARGYIWDNAVDYAVDEVGNLASDAYGWAKNNFF